MSQVFNLLYSNSLSTWILLATFSNLVKECYIWMQTSQDVSRNVLLLWQKFRMIKMIPSQIMSWLFNMMVGKDEQRQNRRMRLGNEADLKILNTTLVDTIGWNVDRWPLFELLTEFINFESSTQVVHCQFSISSSWYPNAYHSSFPSFHHVSFICFH